MGAGTKETIAPRLAPLFASIEVCFGGKRRADNEQLRQVACEVSNRGLGGQNCSGFKLNGAFDTINPDLQYLPGWMRSSERIVIGYLDKYVEYGCYYNKATLLKNIYSWEQISNENLRYHFPSHQIIKRKLTAFSSAPVKYSTRERRRPPRGKRNEHFAEFFVTKPPINQRFAKSPLPDLRRRHM